MAHHREEVEVIGLILARAGSRGVKRKNVKVLGDKPLIAWTIEAAVQAKSIDRVFVTTESDEIAEVARAYGAEVLKRPQALAEDHVQSSEVFLYALRQLNTDYNLHPKVLVFLQPTSPLRTSTQIDEAFEMYGGEGTVIGAVKNEKFHWAIDDEENEVVPVDNSPAFRVGRQWREENTILKEETGALYIIGAEEFSRFRHYPQPPYALYLMPAESNLEIDTEFDWFLAEQWVKYHAEKAKEVSKGMG